MIERVAAWSLGLVLVVTLGISSYLVLTNSLTFNDYRAYWTPALTALIAWVIKGKSNV